MFLNDLYFLIKMLHKLKTIRHRILILLKDNLVIKGIFSLGLLVSTVAVRFGNEGTSMWHHRQIFIFFRDIIITQIDSVQLKGRKIIATIFILLCARTVRDFVLCQT